MGTRADFYVGRGENAEWLGSIAWDGYPEGLPMSLWNITSEEEWRKSIVGILTSREDASLPADGWPWPWEDSGTTDYAYALDSEKVWASFFGREWFDPGKPDESDEDSPKTAVFPNMKGKKNVTLGKRSGLIILSGG